MSTTNEPRALTAALSQPAFVTQGGGLAMHVANRHVSRWAPEVGEPGAQRIRPLRNLGFVDRLVSPWLESAQRSAGLRMFSSYIANGAPERAQAPGVSWVFPRPWYQDELDWMAAARAVTQQSVIAPEASASAPQMLTTRGTYVAPQQQQHQLALPSALYEYVAPSLSIARPDTSAASSVMDAYSPLVPLAATHAAQVMARAVAPIFGARSANETSAARMSPGLRSVLTTMLSRSAAAGEIGPTRASSYAPELVTPPAPRPEASVTGIASSLASESAEPGVAQATAVAEQYAEQRAHIAELQRVARVATEREYVARSQQAATTGTSSAAPSAIAEVRAAEVRAIEQRQAELSQRASDAAAQRGAERTAVDAARRDTERATADAERARIEERIAQRIAERGVVDAQRQEAQRLHATSRDAAARDARVAPVPQPTTAPSAVAERPVESRVATEIAAAVAALPPELASMVAAGIGGRPDRAVQAIAELGEALRAVELIARNTAAGGSIESTRGPRLVMPAGLGGLVATVERTSGGPQRLPQAEMFAPSAQAAPAGVPAAFAAQAARREMRVPALAFLASPELGAQAAQRAGSPAPTSALGAAASMAPAALSHVAWSDRWLARFAGANPRSLDTLAAASASPEMRLEALAAAAPGTVFVAPFDPAGRSESGQLHLGDQRQLPSTVFEAGEAPVRPAQYAPSATEMPVLRNITPTVSAAERFADDAETPDEVFAAIASAANRARATGAAAPAASSRSAVAAATTAERTATFERETLADLVAHAAPSAPGAGISAGLASSPFAPALRHVLPLGVAPTFDVRALFGSGLGATYLAGLLSASSDELSIASQTMPTWATLGQNQMSALSPMSAFGSELGEQPVREVADFSPTYVAPEAAAPRAHELGESSGDAAASYEAIAASEQAAAYSAPLTTLRSALLSWDVETVAAQPGAPAETRFMAPSASSTTLSTSPLARSMIDSLTLPMLGEVAALREPGALDVGGTTAHASSYAAPGMIADRAQSWSVAQERSTSDLSFDFVTPELVLAARVYGLGPAEAAQAARLAIAGPGQLSAMAGAVDRTFVQALAIESERRSQRDGAARALTTAYPLASASPASTAASSATAVSSPAEQPEFDMPMAPPATTSFGVERRAPRGAFLWPAATTAALGLQAAAPDGEMSMSVAALELLAAQAVAELGTYAALHEHYGVGIGEAGEDASASGARRGGGPTGMTGMTSLAGTSAVGSEPGQMAEIDVLASAAAMVPASRRDKFQALYLALGQSPSGRSWSPAARAARALALAGRSDGDGETISARERAAVAWDVLPMVYGLDLESASLSTGEAAVRASRRREELRALDPALAGQVFVDGRPGLSGLSARAGEALGSYVAPGFASATGSAASGTSAASRSEGALLRAPSAAQEMVQTGRPSGRHGGGEVEIPAWFEAAARKMLEDRSGVSDGISLAELTLIQTAAPQQIAASSRADGGSTQPVAPSPAATSGAEKDKIDIDKLANEVYREILVLMDIARARNGEPYL